jgi:hypothetical protein
MIAIARFFTAREQSERFRIDRKGTSDDVEGGFLT